MSDVMLEHPRNCPNPSCRHHTEAEAGFCRKRGAYATRGASEPVQRWQCKGCGTTFTAKTGTPAARQRKPEINKQLIGLLCSGATMRRSARLLGVTYSTVVRRASWLAHRAKEAHKEAMANPKTFELESTHVMLDEMRSFEHSRAKQLTIGVAVRAKTGQIISMHVGRIPTSGKLAKKGREKYSWTKNETPGVLLRMLGDIDKCILKGGIISCDGWPKYPPYIRSVLRPKRLDIKVIPGIIAKNGGFDGLFALNHLSAKIRNDLACMARKTWTTTKKRQKLQERLWLYTAWNNGYRLF